MDFFSHLAWTFLLLARGNLLWQEVLLFGVLPDVLFVGAGLAYAPYLLFKGKPLSDEEAFPVALKVYRVSHSLVTVTALLAALSVFTNSLYYPALAMGLHVFLDLFTHRGSPVEPQMPLYPLEKPAVRGLIWWRNPLFLAANWALIIFIFFSR